MSKQVSVTDAPLVAKLRALCQLSNVTEPVDYERVISYISEAADPEVAARGVMSRLQLPTETLVRKWRGVITDLWSVHHPHVPLLPQLPLSVNDVKDTPTLRDGLAFIQALAVESAQLVREGDEWLIDPKDVIRLARALPSLAGEALFSVESEWGIMTVRRLRAILQATRLIRAVKGRLVPVNARVKRFLSLPVAQQYYILWHADTYHVDWTRFAGLWEQYMQSVQEYLPLLWEAISGVRANYVEDRSHWAVQVLEAFSPLWDDEGLLDVRPGQAVALRIVQQHALPTIVDRFLLRDLFERHGLVKLSEEFGMISKFTWTKVGAAVVAAEASQTLPCGLELMDTKNGRKKSAHPKTF